MPVVLRSRRRLQQGSGVRLQPGPTRRSTRLQPRRESEFCQDSDESDPEPVLSRVMERDQHEQEEEVQEVEEEEQEEEAADEAELELKHCSVLLNRLHPDDKALKKELDNKEDMNRKGVKPFSRIPTFQKRPISTSLNTEPPVPKQDTPVHRTQPPEEATSGSEEASQSKPADVRDTALPLPSAHSPKTISESPFVPGSMDQDATAHYGYLNAAPKGWGLSETGWSLMTASPRAALRSEQDTSSTLGSEAGTIPDSPESSVSHESSLSQNPQEQNRFMLTSSGDTEIAEVSQVAAIMDEEPPWEVELMKEAEQNDSTSSSGAESEEDLGSEKCEGGTSELHEPLAQQSESVNLEKDKHNKSSSPVALEEPAKVSSAKLTKRSRCPCLALLFMLLLGGFGQYVWHYGLPMSVAQLTAQLELHWLQGLCLLPEPCSTDCRVQLVESIPIGLYPSSDLSSTSTSNSWLHLLDTANSSVHITAFYFSLRGSDEESAERSDSQGREVFEQLKQLESKGIKLQIAVNAPQTSTQETAELAATGAQVREVDLKAVTGGIVHTKLWVIDQKHLYIGSANMDWRSLSQVKEVGLSVEDCSCLAQDAFRLFEVYWSIGGVTNNVLPLFWPARLSALSSADKPLQLKFNGVPAQVYLSSSPPQISARGRSDDLSAILSVINDAQKFIYISVMDYLPLSEFTKPLRFWPAIDSALRAAACTRGVQVRLLVSCWEHSPASMFNFLQSLLVLSRQPLQCNVNVKIFTVPSTEEQEKIPFARVNHAKYMVTDRVLYIGTSNWSEDYFTRTAGVGLVVNQTGSVVEEDQLTVQSQAEQLFVRDWNSDYTTFLSTDDVNVCPHHHR
ncbi:phospholipase D3 [Austrofundulus limnaeus]|uniref:Phospholipase D3 n=1 Tax=Austrofundulus limnaeus TaxID=52670 RepID=A0A2I4CSW5_AUSLI|nr:PREDICTED: phospholipase D3-like [Austrofundulus limnaeus]